MKRLILFVSLVSLMIMQGRATNIMGTTQATTDRMYRYVMSNNPGSSFTYQLAQYFHDIGVKWGIRGDIALCQACIETGWFKYEGSIVTPSDHNYGGMGVTGAAGAKETYSTMEKGVNAMLQHLYSYAKTGNLPSGWTPVDKRFAHGYRGACTTWEKLGKQSNGAVYWAASYGYGNKIMSLYKEMMAFSMPTPEIKVSPSSISVSARQNATAATKTITVTGVALESNISVVSNSSKFKTSVSSLGTTGGSVTVTFDTSASPGTYSGYIALVSGSVRVEVPVTLTITGEPSLTVSNSKVTLSADQGAANPTTTVKVTGKYLESDISVGSSSSNFTVTKGSDWDARTGGTLTITGSAAAAGTYTGYIAVQSGQSLRKQIDITMTITGNGDTPVPAQPKLSANVADISLTAKQGDPVPTQSVTVTGENLTADITYNSTLSAFTITPGSDWNARTGGTLIIGLDTSKAVNTYNGTIAIVSGSQRVEIAAVGTITAAPVVTKGSLALKSDVTTWFTCRSANADFMSQGYREATFTVTGTDIDGNITMSFTGDDANELTVTPATLPAKGGTVTVRYTPTVNRGTAYAKPNLVASAANADSQQLTLNITWDGTKPNTGGTTPTEGSIAISGSDVATISTGLGAYFTSKGGKTVTKYIKVTPTNVVGDITYSFDKDADQFTVTPASVSGTEGGTFTVVYSPTRKPNGRPQLTFKASNATSEAVSCVTYWDESPIGGGEVVGDGKITVSGILATLSDKSTGAYFTSKDGASVTKEFKLTTENVSGDITYAFSQDANEFRVYPEKLPSTGGTFTVIYYPTIKPDGWPLLTFKAANASSTISCVTSWDGKPCGVEDITVDGNNDGVSYYTLQGVKVNAENLTPGLYIRREGNKATKVVIK